MQSRNFYLIWILVNPVGFALGSLLGATSNGLLPGLLPGMIGLVMGDLTFGATFGLAQWLVLRRTPKLAVSAWWIAATSVGFMLGARSGALFTYRLATDWLPASVVFGVFMGVSVGLATLLPLSQVIAWPRLAGWLAISLPAWILGEGIAFTYEFAQGAVPLVSLAISGITGLELLRLHSRSAVPG